MNREPLHPITEENIRAYEEDGVVCIRDQFDTGWTEHMLAACLSNMESPAARQLDSSDKDDGGRLVAASHMARNNPMFMDFVIESPAAEIAARLMGLTEVRFFYDQLFVKEMGSPAPTAWHHDLPFWPLDGNHVASVWLALTPVSRETSGLVYVAGSHKWGTLFKPVPAVPIAGFNSTEADDYEDCPAFHKEFGNPDYRFLDWDMKPGDCLVHHPLTVHGAGGNESDRQTRVALSCRFFGGDITWHGHRTKFRVPGTEDADAFPAGVLPADNDVFPVVWRG